MGSLDRLALPRIATRSQRPRRRRFFGAIAPLVTASMVAIATSQGWATGVHAGDRQAPRPTGRWLTPGVGSIVELEPCRRGAAGTLCGRIVWLWDALDDSASPRRDRENSDPKQRARPLVGTEILRGFHESSAGVWTGGAVYNPDDGRTYSGSIRLRADGTLELEGCALRVFCQAQVWRRPEEVLARLNE